MTDNTANDGRDLTNEQLKGLDKILQTNQKINDLHRKGFVTSKDLVASAETYKDSISRSATYLQEHETLLTQMGGSYKNIVEDNKKLLALTSNSKKIQEDMASMTMDEAQAAANVVLQRTMIATHLTGERAQLLATHLTEKGITEELDIQAALRDGSLDGLMKELKHREEIYNKKLDESELNQEIAKDLLEIRGEAESYKKSLDKVLATARAIGNDPKAMGGLLLQQGAKKLEAFTKGFEELREEGLSSGQAIEAQFKGMSFNSMLGLSDTKGVLKGVKEEYGNINALSSENVDELGKMAHHLGITGQQALKLNASLSQMPGETSETATAAMEHTAHLAEAQGIAGSKVFDDMAKNTGTMAKFSKGGAEGFGKAAVELHKMGVEIATAGKMAEGLLDFENSINKQMEASVLLGREINLDKARELALNGDLEGSTAEVLKNIGGAAELEKMTVVQKQALADATGLTVDELNKAADAQQEANKYFGEGASTMDNLYGKAVEYGGATVGFAKENGMAIMSTIQFLQSDGMVRMKNWAIEKAIAAWRFMTGKAEIAQAKLKKDGTLDMRFKENKIPKDLGSKAADKLKGKGDDLVSSAGSGADKMSKVKPSTPGVGKGLKDIASGVKAFGDGKVILGAIIGLPLSAVGLVTMVAGIPALAFAAILGIPAGIGLKGVAEGMESFGSKKVAQGALIMLAVAGSLLLLGAAAMLFAAGGAAGTMLMVISLYALVGAIALLGALASAGIGLIGVGLIYALGVAMLLLGAAVMLAGIGISMVVDAFTNMFAVVSMENIGALLMLGPALYLIAAGMVVFAIGLLVAAPAMLIFGAAAFLASYGVAALALSFGLLGVGLMIASAGLLLMTVAMEQLAESAPLVSGHLVTIAATASGLLLVAGAVWAISAGLGMMALAGLAVLPIIGGLILLAAVAPALVALGGALGDLLGGGGGDEKDDKMDELIGEVRGLKAIMSQGGVINMDGRKVGDVLRLGMTSSGVK